MLMTEELAALIQEIQHTACETMTKVSLTDNEMVNDVEKVTRLVIEPMKVELGFTSNV